MKYELSISADYLSGSSGWDAAAGVREILQNGRDAEVELGAKLTVTHHNDTLRVENAGATLSRDVLLMGQSSKRGKKELAGQFGEGLKLGMLVLVRDGYRVKVRTGGEVWTPAVEASERFSGQRVLTVDVQGGRQENERVMVEVEGITKEFWATLKEKFLFLYPRKIDAVKTPRGSLLLTDRWKGRVYVKGILVQTDPKLAYGYDLTEVTLDRDRRVVASWDLHYELRRIWTDAVDLRPELLEDFTKLLERIDRNDTKGFDSYGADSLSDWAARFVADTFKGKHGHQAVPVLTRADAKDVEHLGVHGVVCSEPMAAVLARTVGDVKTVHDRLRKEVVHTFASEELEPEEQLVLQGAVDLVAMVEPVGAVDVVAFRSDSLMGQFKDDRSLIARRLLRDRAKTLETMVHEVAHRQGHDGDKAHVARIERIWSGIVEKLRGGS